MPAINLLPLPGLLLLLSCNTMDPAEPGHLVPPTVTNDPSLDVLRLSSTELYFAEFGEPTKPPVFILEGGPGDDFTYLLDLDKIVNDRRLSDDYHLIYHDYRGCGLSRRHPTSELTLAHSLKDLEELIDHFAAGEQVILLGHSHGAVVATQYINEHPGRVRAAVLIEPGALSEKINRSLPSAGDVDLFGADVNRILWVKQLIGQGNHATADYFFGVARVNIDADNRGQSCPSANTRGGAAAAIAIAIGEVNDGDYDFTTNLADFDREVLFVSSDESDLGFAFQEAEQRHLFPTATHELIRGTGHNGLINCTTDTTVTLIRDYLARN